MQISIRSLRILRFFFEQLVLVSLALAPLVGQAADAPKPVFVRGSCLDKISSDVVSSLKEGIRTSQRYRLARNLGDGDRMGPVLTINVSCTERKDFVAIATVLGAAKCFSAMNCHLAIDGSSIRADLCDANTAAECGKAIFKAFDDYTSNPIKPPLRVQ
jgi:hypothetical protein